MLQEVQGVMRLVHTLASNHGRFVKLLLFRAVIYKRSLSPINRLQKQSKRAALMIEQSHRI
jgi:hypothetical protein